MSNDQEAASEWARQLLSNPDAVILDTETTGLSYDAECCQIAVIDLSGAVLLDTLVKPSIPISIGAMRVHGITNERVQDAPTFDRVWPQLRAILAGREVVIYNAEYDLRVLNRSGGASGVALRDLHPELPTPNRPTWIGGARMVTCAMVQYAAYVGDWSSYHQSYRFQKLPNGDHTALGDARATLAVIQLMAKDGEL